MKLLLLSFFQVLSLFSISQNQKIKITYVNFNDTFEPAQIKFKNVLFIDGLKSASFKYPYEFKAPGMHTITTFNGKKKFEYYSAKDTVKLYVFKSLSENLLWFQPENDFSDKFSKTYLDSLHPFVWNFTSESKKTGNQIWKKAVMRFRGRNYIAWYDESIPLSHGPWKFGGLPGLIMEIYDESFSVYWRLTKFEKTEETLPDFPQNIQENFSNFKKSYKDFFLRFKKSIESSNGLENPDCKNCTGTTKTVTDNSVEYLTLDQY